VNAAAQASAAVHPSATPSPSPSRALRATRPGGSSAGPTSTAT